MKVLLASASPRRRELLAQIVPEFEVFPFQGEEIITGDTPPAIVKELAAQKAQWAAEAAAGTEEELLIIGADTLVVLEGQTLGKPSDEAEAFRMLRALSGHTHQVYTGVCLILSREGEHSAHTFSEVTDVTFYPMSDEEILAYIASGDPMDKAGAYGIQSGCGRYIRGIRGDYNNVVGLPVARLYHELQNFIKS